MIIQNKYLFIALVILLESILISCKTESPKIVEDKIREPKVIKNIRFQYLFEIPTNWHTVEVSDNGDGYSIRTSKNEDIRIYGEEITDENRIPVFECVSEKTFVFADGHNGTRCDNNDETFIFRSEKNRRVIFYVKPKEALNDSLIMIAKSMVLY